MRRPLPNLLPALSLAVALGVLVVWGRSEHITDRTAEGTFGPGVVVTSTGGALWVEWTRINPSARGGPGILEAGLGWDPADTHWRALGFSYSCDASPYTQTRAYELGIPYWTFVALALVAPAWRLRLVIREARRLERGQCPRCGFDLRASRDRCPECGDVVPGMEELAK